MEYPKFFMSTHANTGSDLKDLRWKIYKDFGSYNLDRKYFKCLLGRYIVWV